MADLTKLEAKLAEVLGLAQAAKGATDTVKGMFDGDSSGLVATLSRMHDEAAATEERCTTLAGSFEGKKTAILDKAREVKGEATDMMKTYLAGEDEALDGFEFLAMAEAGELCHWEIVQTMADTLSLDDVSQLADWAVEVQRGHIETVRTASLELAQHEARA